MVLWTVKEGGEGVLAGAACAGFEGAVAVVRARERSWEVRRGDLVEMGDGAAVMVRGRAMRGMRVLSCYLRLALVCGRQWNGK